ncbi:MAG: M28 family peptidase [candidate division KSB1 bacterium]|nr:M28 family peptidase [candidate division KSB1 bacterium]
MISADSLRRHIEFLGSDSLEGRAVGTRGERKAADYIAARLRAYGLKPLGDNGTYFQTIPMHGSRALKESELTLFFGDEKHELRLGEDYLLLKTGAQTFIPQAVPLVFVGFGIIAPEFDYNDYQSLDAEGKIAVMLTGEPYSGDPSYFAGEDPTIYSLLESKQRTAVSRGAMGCLFIPAPMDADFRDWEKKRREFAFEEVTLAYWPSGHFSAVINPDSAAKLFRKAPFSLNQVYEMYRRSTVRSFAMHASLSFHGRFLERDFIGTNVLGLIEGKEKGVKASFLLISAHFDHLGIGPSVNGDSIYNGVLDNAVGAAAALELARVFAASRLDCSPSMIFLFTTGEEKGLIGSRLYCDHPPVPLHKTLANLNIDGLATLDDFKDVVGVGAELSTLGDYLKETADRLNLRVSPVPSPFLAHESFARSDQLSFAQAGIPAILISEGLNTKNLTLEQALQYLLYWYENIYHSPFDDLSQPIHYGAAVKHVQVLATFCLSLLNAKTTPQWRPGTGFLAERLRTIAEKR